jgi:K+-transporting ATPase ATPase A chain
MTGTSVALIALFLLVMLLLVKPLGLYMANVMEGRPIWALRVGGGLERLLYRLGGVDPAAEMGWKRYMIALLLFNAVGALALYAIQRLQLWLPLNPQQLANVSPDSSFNTAVSFVTNTNWQGYSGESTMSYLTQMAGLAVQNFLSAATGIAVVIALIRGFARHTARSIGNFWTDVTRATLYILLPLSTLLAIVLVGQGVVQNFTSRPLRLWRTRHRRAMPREIR